jgi:phosphatidylethanolamine-binding protein (PEBP) family uncharacterized protein
LWVHTLMVAEAVDTFAWTYTDRDAVTNTELDYALAAAILHDQRKNGSHEDPEDTSASDHDLQMASVIRQDSELPDAVANAVARHMGPSYDGPVPGFGDVSDLVHMADYTASRSNFEVSLSLPVPDELQALDVPTNPDSS